MPTAPATIVAVVKEECFLMEVFRMKLEIEVKMKEEDNKENKENEVSQS